MKFDITWTITAVIAASSILSSILVAIINNKYQSKIRKMELEHAEYMHQLDLHQQSTIRQFDIYYADKKKAFSDFAAEAGNYAFNTQSAHSYNALHSSIAKALLFCNTENQIMLCDFLKRADDIFGKPFSLDDRYAYSQVLNKVSLSLNNELQSTKPVIQSKRCEH